MGEHDNLVLDHLDFINQIPRVKSKDTKYSYRVHSGGGNDVVVGVPTMSVSSSVGPRWYFECQVESGKNWHVGWVKANFKQNLSSDAKEAKLGEASSWVFGVSGGDQCEMRHDGGFKHWGNKLNPGDYIGCAVDFVTGTIAFSHNGLWESSTNGVPTTAAYKDLDLNGVTLFPACDASGAKVTFSFGPEFVHDPPDAWYRPVCESGSG